MRRETAQSQHDVDKLLVLGEVYRTLLVALGYVADDVHNREDDVCWSHSGSMVWIPDPRSGSEPSEWFRVFIQ